MVVFGEVVAVWRFDAVIAVVGVSREGVAQSERWGIGWKAVVVVVEVWDR